jgi:biopolymer transport protein TolR
MKRDHSHKKTNKLVELASKGFQSSINVTPFVDVCLVLLIIFMVVTPMLQEGIPVNLPKTAQPEKTEVEEQLIVSIRQPDLVYVGNTVRRMDQVERALKDFYEQTPNVQVAVKGDVSLRYGDVMEVLRACREVGYENVGLVTEPRDRSIVSASH